MSENEGAPKPPPDERDSGGATGDAQVKSREASPDGTAHPSDTGGQGAIDVDLAHDRAS